LSVYQWTIFASSFVRVLITSKFFLWWS